MHLSNFFFINCTKDGKLVQKKGLKLFSARPTNLKEVLQVQAKAGRTLNIGFRWAADGGPAPGKAKSILRFPNPLGGGEMYLSWAGANYLIQLRGNSLLVRCSWAFNHELSANLFFGTPEELSPPEFSPVFINYLTSFKFQLAVKVITKFSSFPEE